MCLTSCCTDRVRRSSERSLQVLRRLCRNDPKLFVLRVCRIGLWTIQKQKGPELFGAVQ
ncbi:unnamed protein product [Ectocarpus sp. CCAP 1310/34]|nr:unnamed protein product [Ectocarpus sp. CCAP 1310/34]